MQMKATNASSSGVSIDPRRLRELMVRRDAPGLIYLLVWSVSIVTVGWLVAMSEGHAIQSLAMFALGTILTVPAYALSHECTHGTFLKTAWLNTLVNGFTSLIYFEEPAHRFAAHMRHHNFTWLNNLDAQMPYATPLTLSGWLREISGLDYLVYELKILALNATGHHGKDIRAYTPARNLPRLKWGARAFIAIYVSLIGLVTWSGIWPEALTFYVIPRLMGGFAMQVFTITQHADMAEDQHDLRLSCRSFETNRFGRFLYAEMNRHVEHHLFPKVPFHALHKLRNELGDQLPVADKGLLATNWQIFRRAFTRSVSPPTTQNAPPFQ